MKTFKSSVSRLFSSATLLTIALILSSISSSFAQAQKLTDPEIASVAVTANKVDINAAKLAKDKSKNADVLKFADMMAKDHQSVIDQCVALVTKLKVTPKDNMLSKKLMTDADAAKKMLSEKTGRKFDMAYMENEVIYHKAVISTVQNVLIPQAQNEELKDLLEKVLPIIKEHLKHAQMVQKMLTKQ